MDSTGVVGKASSGWLYDKHSPPDAPHWEYYGPLGLLNVAVFKAESGSYGEADLYLWAHGAAYHATLSTEWLDIDLA